MNGAPLYAWRIGASLAMLAACSLAQSGALHDRPGTGRDADRRAEGGRCCSQIGLARYLERSQIVRSSENYRLDVMSNDWWGEPLGGDAEPRAGRGTEPAPAAEHGVRRERGGVGAARRDDRAERPAARRGRDGQPRAAGPGSVIFKARGRADCAASASPCRRRRRTCRARSRRSAPRSASSPTASGDAQRCDWPGRTVRRCCGPADGNARAAAARMPGLRTVPDDPAAGAGHDRRVLPLHHDAPSRATSHPLDHSLALTLAALVLLVVMCTTTLMSVETAGIAHSADLFSGPEELVRRGMTALAAVVVFVTVLAPVRQADRHALCAAAAARARPAAPSSPCVRARRAAARPGR